MYNFGDVKVCTFWTWRGSETSTTLSAYSNMYWAVLRGSVLWKHLCPLKTLMLCSLVTEPARICMLQSLTQSGGFFCIFAGYGLGLTAAGLWGPTSLAGLVLCGFLATVCSWCGNPESPCAAKTCGRPVALSSTAARLLPKITPGTKPTGLPLSARTSLSVEALAWILGHGLQRWHCPLQGRMPFRGKILSGEMNGVWGGQGTL